MAARKRWRRYIPDDEISVRAFLHLIDRQRVPEPAQHPHGEAYREERDSE